MEAALGYEVEGKDVMDTIEAITPALQGRPEPIVYVALLALAVMMRSSNLSGDDIKDGALGASQWIVDYVAGKEGQL